MNLFILEEKIMMNIIYKNPLSKVYQYEYAIYVILSSYFRSAVCESKIIEKLWLYYSDLVKTTPNGNFSYEKQYQIEEESEALITNGIIGNIHMPHMDERDVIIIVDPNEDGTHSFTFKSGAYSFSYRLVLEEIKSRTPYESSENEYKRFKISIKVLDSQK